MVALCLEILKKRSTKNRLDEWGKENSQTYKLKILDNACVSLAGALNLVDHDSYLNIWKLFDTGR